MKGLSKQRNLAPPDAAADIHSIDGLLWGLPVRLGLAAEQHGGNSSRSAGATRPRVSKRTRRTEGSRWYTA